MELNKFSDADLIAGAKEITDQERALVTKLLKYLLEIESRRLHLARGFPSLFEFCTDELRLSRAEAHIRIQAMRLMRAVPEIEKKIDEGTLSLSVAASIQGTFRRHEKKIGRKVPWVEKKDVISKLTGSSTRAADKTLAALYPETVVIKEKIRTVSEDLTRIEFYASNRLIEKLEKLKALTAHKNFDGRMDVMIEQMADVLLEKINPVSAKMNSTKAVKTTAVGTDSATLSATTDKVAKNKLAKTVDATVLSAHEPVLRTRYIKKPIKRIVWSKANGRCEYVDPLSGRRCDCAHALQIDHIHEFAKGGGNEVANLRLLCGAHNRWRNMTG